MASWLLLMSLELGRHGSQTWGCEGEEADGDIVPTEGTPDRHWHEVVHGTDSEVRLRRHLGPC